MFCSKTLPGWAGLFRGWLGHMLGALDLTRPIVRADKAMQAETMVHIGEEGGEQLRGCTMRSFPGVSTHSRGKNSLADNVLTAPQCMRHFLTKCIKHISIDSRSERTSGKYRQNETITNQPLSTHSDYN